MRSQNPAVLWYTSDYLVGTMGMSWEEKGRYVELLNLQHQHGHLDIFKLMPDCPASVLEKFVQDESGLYYNERMEEEIIKRNKFVESRRNNRTKKDDPAAKREKIENKMEALRSLSQANLRDRSESIWQND